MAVKPLVTSVRQLAGVAIIDLTGEIDSFAEETLNSAYAEANQANPRAIVLNFTKVNYINSTGIALIVSLLAQAMKNHRQLLTYGLSSHYIEIFEITRLADFISIFPDEVSAISAVPA